MVSLCVFFTRSLNLIYMEVITNIQCYFSPEKNCYTIEEIRKILTTMVVAYLVIYNGFVSNIYIEGIHNKK